MIRRKKKKEPAPWRVGILDHHKRDKPTWKENGEVSPVTAEHVYERDEYRCVRCKKGIYDRDRYGFTVQLNICHIQGKGQYGGGERENLILLCGPSTNHDTCHFFIDSTRAGREYAKRYQEQVLIPLYGRDKK
jgi:5-methylcytosine-specific restriction endonuclease McrA